MAKVRYLVFFFIMDAFQWGLGAGIGERVLVVHGRAARHVMGRGHDIGFQTAVAAIIDRMELANGRAVGTTQEEDLPAH